jgi:hypothetical protein
MRDIGVVPLDGIVSAAKDADASVTSAAEAAIATNFVIGFLLGLSGGSCLCSDHGNRRAGGAEPPIFAYHWMRGMALI